MKISDRNSRCILKAALAAGGLLFAAPGAQACSQCMCGSPFPLTFLSAPMPSNFRVGLEDQYLSKSNAGDEPGSTESEVEHRVAVFLLGRPHPRVLLQLRAPVAFKRLTLSTSEGRTLMTSRGIGDGDLSAHVVIRQTLNGSVAVIGGGTLPTGQHSLRDSEGEFLETHLQPGTGAWSGLIGLEGAARASGGSWNASVLFRANSRNSRGYRYGNLALIDLGFVSEAMGAWQWSLQFQGRTATEDDDNSETVASGEATPSTQVANTGGSILYLAPSVRIGEAPGISLNLGTQLPLVRSLKGEQTEHPTARISISISPE